MIRSQLRQIVQHGDRVWVGMNMPIRHFSVSSVAAAEGPTNPPPGMRAASFFLCQLAPSFFGFLFVLSRMGFLAGYRIQGNKMEKKQC